MKKLTFAITALVISSVLIACILGSCSKPTERESWLYKTLVQARDSVYFQKKRIQELQFIINAYENYYISTEEFLDSIGIDPDHYLLETDAGAQYLEDKVLLDEIFIKYEYNKQYPIYKVLNN